MKQSYTDVLLFQALDTILQSKLPLQIPNHRALVGFVNAKFAVNLLVIELCTNKRIFLSRTYKVFVAQSELRHTETEQKPSFVCSEGSGVGVALNTDMVLCKAGSHFSLQCLARHF